MSSRTVPDHIRRSGLALTSFHTLDPRLLPREVYPEAVIQLSRLHVHNLGSRLRAGSMAVEAGVGAPDPGRSERMLRIGYRYLNPVACSDICSNRYFDNHIRARRYLGVAALKLSGDSNEPSYKSFLSAQLKDMLALRDAYDSEVAKNPAALDGYISEGIVTALLHNPQAGLVATTSFYRQDQDAICIDGKKYSWDVTLESRGDAIPEGLYRLQVKTVGHGNEADSYHPDITYIAVNRDIEETPEFVNRHAATRAYLTGADMLDTKVRLLAKIADHGPADDRLVFQTACL